MSAYSHKRTFEIPSAVATAISIREEELDGITFHATIFPNAPGAEIVVLDHCRPDLFTLRM